MAKFKIGDKVQYKNGNDKGVVVKVESSRILFRDEDGMVWAGTESNLKPVSNAKFKIGDKVRHIDDSNDGQVGTVKGIYGDGKIRVKFPNLEKGGFDGFNEEELVMANSVCNAKFEVGKVYRAPWDRDWMCKVLSRTDSSVKCAIKSVRDRSWGPKDEIVTLRVQPKQTEENGSEVIKGLDWEFWADVTNSEVVKNAVYSIFTADVADVWKDGGYAYVPVEIQLKGKITADYIRKQVEKSLKIRQWFGQEEKSNPNFKITNLDELLRKANNSSSCNPVVSNALSWKRARNSIVCNYSEYTKGRWIHDSRDGKNYIVERNGLMLPAGSGCSIKEAETGKTKNLTDAELDYHYHIGDAESCGKCRKFFKNSGEISTNGDRNKPCDDSTKCQFVGGK